MRFPSNRSRGLNKCIPWFSFALTNEQAFFRATILNYKYLLSCITMVFFFRKVFSGKRESLGNKFGESYAPCTLSGTFPGILSDILTPLAVVSHNKHHLLTLVPEFFWFFFFPSANSGSIIFLFLFSPLGFGKLFSLTVLCNPFLHISSITSLLNPGFCE